MICHWKGMTWVAIQTTLAGAIPMKVYLKLELEGAATEMKQVSRKQKLKTNVEVVTKQDQCS